MNEVKIAIILIRGMIGMHPDTRKTLELLRIKNKHVCVVISNTKENIGMLHKIKDYTTFGIITQDTFELMLEKRGEMFGGEKLLDKILIKKIANEFFLNKLKPSEFLSKYKVKPFFRLAPPIGGFERGGIKMPFSKKGVLGDRIDKINILIKKML